MESDLRPDFPFEGHVNFSDEVTSSIRLSDGIVLFIDAAEGVSGSILLHVILPVPLSLSPSLLSSSTVLITVTQTSLCLVKGDAEHGASHQTRRSGTYGHHYLHQ